MAMPNPERIAAALYGADPAAICRVPSGWVVTSGIQNQPSETNTAIQKRS